MAESHPSLNLSRRLRVAAGGEFMPSATQRLFNLDDPEVTMPPSRNLLAAPDCSRCPLPLPPKYEQICRSLRGLFATLCAMDGYSFSCPIQVRWRDLDAFRHVNNATFASYLEMARTDAWTSLFGGRNALAIPFFVKRIEIDYKRPIGLEDEVRVWLRVGETRGASFSFEYLVEAGGEVAATAVTRLACVDKNTGKPAPIDPDVRAKLETLSTNQE